MYDLPAVRWANDALWAALADALQAAGIPAPPALDRRPDHAAVWTESGLLLSQTCGYPYATRLRGRVRLVATPVYRAEGCEGARYRSVLLVREDDPARKLDELRGRRVAVNAADSQSGHNALRAAVAPLATAGRFFASVVVTGAHSDSMRVVAEGRADLCAVDCVTWALIRHHEPTTADGLRSLGWTAAVPGLPLVTASEGPVAALREALYTVLAAAYLAPARAALLLEGCELVEDSAYEAILAQERTAHALCYPALA
jgi:ABC-type phosphate/phosphonate transport system substrate-binding protein